MTESRELAFEAELIGDAARDLVRIVKALPRRHGAPFRALERRIVALTQPSADCAVRLHELEPGRWIFEPPAEWTALIAEARALRVI